MGPFFFIEQIITDTQHLDMMELWLMPQFEEDSITHSSFNRMVLLPIFSLLSINDSLFVCPP
jgi:hypothetical protein